jgi:hypothetical protein
MLTFLHFEILLIPMQNLIKKSGVDIFGAGAR